MLISTQVRRTRDTHLSSPRVRTSFTRLVATVCAGALLVAGADAAQATAPSKLPKLTKQVKRTMRASIRQHERSERQRRPLARSSLVLDPAGYVAANAQCNQGFMTEDAYGRRWGRSLTFSSAEPWIKSRNGGAQYVAALWGMQHAYTAPQVTSEQYDDRWWYAITDNAAAYSAFRNTGSMYHDRLEWTDFKGTYIPNYSLTWKVQAPYQNQWNMPTLTIYWFNYDGTVQAWNKYSVSVDSIMNRWCYLPADGTS